MKKSLLVISVILLIAGLFIACNSEAAGTNSEVGYVKFGGSADSKSLSSSVTPEDMPSMNSLYWYYKASPVSPGLFVRGEQTSWTRVNNSGTGFGGPIGPFTKGNWQFELVGSTSETAPENTSFNNGTWTVNDNTVKYYGVSGTAYDTKTSVYINGAQDSPTPIGVSLKFNSSATPNKFTLVLHDLTLIDSEYLVNGKTVYYKVTNDTTQIGETGNVTTAYHKAVISTDVVVNNVSCSSGEPMSLTVGVYEDSTCQTVVSTASVEFIPLTGSTVSIYGSLPEPTIEVGYGEFGLAFTNPELDGEAYVYNGQTATKYATLTAALEAATAGQTVGLLKDVAYTSGSIEITKGITLEGNGHTITNTRAASGSDLNGDISGRDAAVYLNNAGKTVRINNLNISTTKIGFIYVGTTDTSGTKADGGTINISNCRFITSGQRYGFFVNNYVSDLTVSIDNSELQGWAAIYAKSKDSTYTVTNSILTGVNEVGTAPSNEFGTIVFESPAGISDNGRNHNIITITGSTINALPIKNAEEWLCLQYGAHHNTVTVTNTSIKGTDGHALSDVKWETAQSNTHYVLDPSYSGTDPDSDEYYANWRCHNTVTIDGAEIKCFHGTHL